MTILALTACAILAAFVPAEEQSRSVVGKIDFAALLEAAPGMPTTPAEAGKRAYGPDIKAQEQPVALDSFYAPFYQRVAAARDVIKDAVANRGQNQEALMQRSIAQTEANPIVNRMGGIDKINDMSEEETKQAAAQAVGSYQQSLAGGPGNASSGGGMQAMMQRMMSDPAYQERFEKMTQKEQEAELQKYMGNAHAPAPPVGETAAERRAKRDVKETTAVVAEQNELGAIVQRLAVIDAEFAKKDQRSAGQVGTTRLARRSGPEWRRSLSSKWVRCTTAIRPKCRCCNESKPRVTAPALPGNCNNVPRSMPSARPDPRKWPPLTRPGSGKIWGRSIAKPPSCWTTPRSRWQSGVKRT